jgi:hypothetical protein
VDHARAAEGFGRIQKELQAEKAAALARIAGRLEELVRELAELRGRIDAEPEDPRERLDLLERYDERRDLAERFLWYLQVQREAVGITCHDSLAALYPIPGPITTER